MFIFALVLITICGVQGQYLLPGKCPEVTPMPNFSLEKMLGKWYLHQNVDVPGVRKIKCIFGVLTRSKNRDTLLANGEFIDVTTNEKKLFAETFKAEKEMVEIKHKSGVKLKGMEDFIVIGADYSNFAILWGCQPEKEGKSLIYFWIKTRKPTLSDAIKKEIDGILKEKNIPKLPMYTIENENCI